MSDTEIQYTSIRLKAETARRLRVLVVGMKAAEPDTIKTTDDVVTRLIERQGYSANAAKIEALLADWQGRFGGAVGKEVIETYNRIGDHVVEYMTELRRLLRDAETEDTPENDLIKRSNLK